MWKRTDVQAAAELKVEDEAKGVTPDGKWLRRYDPLTQLVLTVPVFLIYHLGILFLDIRNGVDFASVFFWRLLRTSTSGYIAATLLISAALLGAGALLQKKHRIRPIAFAPLLAESTALAVLMMVSVGWLTAQVVSVFHAERLLDGSTIVLSPFAKIVLSCGAGFHEEAVFRAVLFGGLVWLGRRYFNRAWVAVAVAAIVSSLLFSAVHYIGALGDGFTLASFFFRALAGLYLAAVYRLRGFAVAVYTHTIYDIFVMFFFGA